MGESETKEEKPKWIKMKSSDVEKAVIEASKEASSPSEIGLILRDKQGIPKVKQITNKRISQILKEKDIKLKTESDIFKEKIEKLKTHMEKNGKDTAAPRALTKLLWRLKKAQ